MPARYPEDEGAEQLPHDTRGGGISPAQIQKRAREIALIAGREAEDVSEADIDRARRELLASERMQTRPEAETEDIVQVSENPADPYAKTGAQHPPHKPTDPELTPARETRDGVEDAEHDTMLAGRRKTDREALE